jgi:hypothetical protein
MNVIFNKVKPKQFLTIGDHGRYVLPIPEGIEAIGVDPWPAKKDKELAPNQSIFPVTSDYFFHSVYMTRGINPDIVLITKIQRVEHVLRDIIFSEKLCKDNAVIMITGTCPADVRDTERSAQLLYPTQVGDVYKLIPIIKKLRPKIKISTITDIPDGVTILENLDKTDNVMQMKMVQSLVEVFGIRFEDRDRSTYVTFDDYARQIS